VTRLTRLHGSFAVILYALLALLAPVVLAATPAAEPHLSIRVAANKLLNAEGIIQQLRGVAYGNSAFAFISGLSQTDAFGGPPLLRESLEWKANAWRISLNEASWLGLDCVDTDGVRHVTDPGPAHGAPSYRQQIVDETQKITAAHMYTILVLHWAAPDNHCPLTQTQMADADHSLDFWRSVALTFKSNPAVLFELYNEPFDGWLSPGQQGEAVIEKGGTFDGYPAQPNYRLVNNKWKVASMQDMITAVRGAGASNVVLVGTDGWDNDLDAWLENAPKDPLGQMAAAWHPYPPWKQIKELRVISGGSHYAVNDTITLPSPNYGTGIYEAAIAKVTQVSNGAVTAVSMVKPGRYLATKLPSAQLPQGSSSGTGVGAGFEAQFVWGGGGGSMPSKWSIAEKIAALYPVIFTEMGDHNQAGTVGAPWLSELLPWADKNGMSYIGWWFEASGEPDNVLLKDNRGTPSDGYGRYYHDHLICIAAGTAGCP
jgi:Cellulase (glycosyl hydrolase family 5)